jgi:hypothetical protein
MERITVRHLRPLVERMNTASGRPEGEADWTREDPCTLCKGSGEAPPAGWTDTPAGRAYVADYQHRLELERNPDRCPRCYGHGSRLTAAIGRYTLAGAYGGWNVHRYMNEGGGVTEPIGRGYVPARELYGLIHAYLRGLEECPE